MLSADHCNQYLGNFIIVAGIVIPANQFDYLYI